MAGRYKAYPEYKRFNSTWFDSLPSHWQSVSMKWITNLYAGGTPSKDNLSFWENGSIPWLNSGSVNQSVIKKPSAFITRDAFNNSSAKWIPKGSLVMALAGQGKTKGMVAQLAIESTCNQSMAAIVPSQIVYPRFLFWWLTSNYQKIRNMAGGDLRDGLNLDLLGNISCPIFECKEQQKIANFLDHETAKIDTLIAKQEKLIELLKEKRQAVISHAVTKGLNPQAPMKDSGVEWLGEVPEHWTVGRVKNLAKLISKGTTPSTIGGDFIDKGIRFLKGENIGKSLFVNPSPTFYISEEVDAQLSRSRLQENDVLVIIAGATTGKASILTKELLPANTNQAVSFIRPKKAIYSKLITLWFSTEFAQRIIWMGAVQAAQPNLSMENLGNLPIVLPDEVEIAPLLNEIDKKVEQFDALIIKANSAIELMKERKTALISAAVTGKIDVRDWEPK
ncbi:restriction endonuclease subunit S [Vibrio cholerae]|uniref:restriction endonuclease subunit S n=1 Tax=Vibrio cholerae TaxID=666 RepID=UPI0006644B55|nr:restriction endonuclease subunit S [Vibrio cholerae]EJT1339267.1 restriction endonuclease subunit S [Vibrio vulnificus]CRZ54342.1 type I restriction-modification system specificity determinant [Vibrio cholerae]CSC23560.1 type I restriction-modification system specificity determinant [Vibrio cholerae]CSC59123.1 type I restriction-modification system specificity determinant [Vibrio cholerae]HAS4493365.1 restriction endonuclease subunit S [Vibrio cholerae]